MLRQLTDFLSSAASFVFILFAVPMLTLGVFRLTLMNADMNAAPEFVRLLGMGFYFMMIVPMSLLMFTDVIYVAVIVICPGILLSGLVNSHATTRWRVAYVVGIVGILLYAVAPYYMPLAAAEGYSMQIVSKPPPGMNGLRFAQAAIDIKPCRYEVIGWADQVVYYNWNCGGLESTWRFRPNQDKKPTPAPVPANAQVEKISGGNRWIKTNSTMPNSRHLWLYSDNFGR